MIPSAWRIVFFGTTSFAAAALKALLSGPDLVLSVVTQPDRKKGRGLRIHFPVVKEMILQYGRDGICLFQPGSVKEEVFQREMRRLDPDLFVVAAYGQILPKSLLDIPSHGAINIHASLLPKYRGAAPMAWAILKGEASTGVTIMKMDEGMDTGDILLQEEIPIGEAETAQTLHDKVAPLGARLLLQAMEKMKSGEISARPQDGSRASYAPPLKKEDSRIDWKKEAKEIDRQVRAFNPSPGACTLLEGHLLKVFAGVIREREPEETGERGKDPGGILWVGTDSVEVRTGKGSFLIKEVQLEGKRKMSVRKFLAGHDIPAGTVLGQEIR